MDSWTIGTDSKKIYFPQVSYAFTLYMDNYEITNNLLHGPGLMERSRMSSQHYIVSLYITDVCLLERLCFFEVDIKFLQTMLWERRKS